MSSVIKASQNTQGARGFMGLNLRDIKREADEIVGQARQEAARIIEESRALAKREREAIHAAAKAEGYKVGLDMGRDEGRADGIRESKAAFEKNQSALIDTLTSLIGEFGDQRDSLYAQSRRDVVLLAVVIASRIVRHLSEDKSLSGEIAVNATEEALELVRTATDVRLHVHPTDAHAMELFVENIGATVSRSKHFQIVEDESVGRGGVVVETAQSTIDGTIDARLEKIAGELIEHWRERLGELAIKR